MAITDRAALQPVQVGIAIACTLQRLYPKEFKLALVDTLLNRAASVQAIRDGDAWKKVVADWEQETQAFAARRMKFLHYSKE